MKPREPCTSCPLYDREGIVVPTGVPESKLWVIGEAPGPSEISTLRPWSGGAGRMLDRCLESADLRRSDIYLTNIVRCRPPGDRPPSTKESNHCTDYFIRPLIELHSPRVVLTLGAQALKEFTTNDKIMSSRGYVFRLNSKTLVVPTVNPAAVFHNKRINISVVQSDFAKAARLLRDPTLEPLDYPILIGHETVLRLALERGYVCLDIETSEHPSFWDRTLDVVGVGWSDKVLVMSAPFTRADIELIGSLLSTPTIAIRGQNISFDIVVLMSLGFKVSGELQDTIQLHHAIYSELPHKLEFLGSIYLNCEPWKQMRKSKLEDVK